MKKLVVFFALAVFLTLWAFGLILPDAGYVLVLLGHKSVESSLWFVCFVLVGAAFIWWMLKKFARVSWSLAQSITDFLVYGTTERASKRAANGVIDFFTGDWIQARKKLVRTMSRVESPLVNYIVAARSSYALGDREEAYKLLTEAQKKFPQSTVTIGLVQAKLALRDGQLDKAKHILVGLQQKVPKHPFVLLNLCKLYQARGEWSALTEIFPLVKKYKLHSAGEIFSLEASLIEAQLSQESEIAQTASATDRIFILRKAWSGVPNAQQKNPYVVAAYARALMAQREDREAEQLLRKVLSKTWDESLVDLYGLLAVQDIADAVRTAENWLKYYPQSPNLLRALGRLSLRNGLWGVARDYFQRSVAAQPNLETYAELSRLLGSLGDTQKCVEIYQAALALHMAPLPELPQPAKVY